MSNGNLKFSLVMQAVTNEFNSAVKQAKLNYQEATASVRTESSSLDQATAQAGKSLSDVFKVADTKAIVGSLDSASAAVKDLKGNTALSVSAMAQLGFTAKQALDSVDNQVAEVRAELERLRSVKATPDDLNNAKQKLSDVREEAAKAKIEYDALKNAKVAPVDLAAAKEKLDTLKASAKTAREELAQLRQIKASPDDIDTAQKKLIELNDASVSIRNSYSQFERTAVAALGEVTYAEAKLVQEAEAAKTAIYGSLSVRPSTAIHDEIARINAELAKFKAESGAPAAEIARVTAVAESKIAGLKAELSGVSPVTDKATESVKGMGVSFVNLQSILASIGISLSIKEISDLADSYKNLQARIKLVTGEGDAFKSAFEGVHKIALTTNTSLESTGNLFTKIYQAGKEFKITQQQALDLTKTVNQAIQLSGASAEASDAAVTQLIQGLQSGVLRGDEFNSVMEQAPRLASALAAGLNVTTGELRKMAEAGQLSSETVIKALKNQSSVVESEFGKLPATVGRALTNLKTNLEIYVGEVDKANGISTAAAKALSALANNISEIASVLKIAAEAAIAYKAVDLATFLFAKSQAATAASVAIAKEATALGIDTVANVENTAATRATAIAKTQLALASNVSTTAVTNAGRGALSLTGNLATLGNGFVGVLSKMGAYGLAAFGIYEGGKALIGSFDAVGTSIGEYIGKLTGVKSAEDLLSASQKQAAINANLKAEQLKANAKYTQDLTDKTLGLNKESKALITLFEASKTAGDSLVDSLGKVNSAMHFDNAKGINDSVTALEALRLKGKITGDDVQKSLSEMLKGVDLQTFQLNAQHAFDGTANAAQKLAVVMKATLAEAVKRTGLDVDDLKGHFTAQANSAINDIDTIIQGMDKLKEQGIDVERALSASIANGIKTADSQREVDALTARIEATRKVLGDKITDGLLDQAKQKAIDLKGAIDAITPGINSAAEAMKALGIVSDETLKNTSSNSKDAFNTLRDSGKASTRELSDAFKKYATDAIAANNGVADGAIQGQAAMYGLEIKVDSAGQACVVAMGEASRATDRAYGSTQRLAQGYKDVGQQAQEAAAKSKAASDAAYENHPKELNGALNGLNLQHYSLDAVIQKFTSAGFDLAEATRRAKEIMDTDLQRRQEYARSAGFGNLDVNKITNAAGVDAMVAEALKYKAQTDVRNSGAGNSFADPYTVSPPQLSSQVPTLPNSAVQSGKTIAVNFTLGGKQVSAQINSTDESSFLAMLEQAKGLS